MKMSTLNRVLFFFYQFVIIVILSVLFLVSVGIWPMDRFMADIKVYGWPWFALLSLVLLAISLKYFFLSIVSPKVQSTLLKHTNVGMIRISLSMLDSITQKTVRTFPEVKDVKTSVVPEADAVKIRVILFIMPEVNIPELTLAVQSRVKEQVEAVSGIAAKEVQVYVENVQNSNKLKLD